MIPPRSDAPAPGPLESGTWPDKLRARVITPGDAPRVHGYDIEGDVAQHHGYGEYLLLCLTGELPTPERARAFDAVCMFLGPLSVAYAPTHAAVLSRLCGARNSGTIGVAAIGLAEQARSLLAEHESLLGWLAQPEREFPKEHRAAAAGGEAAASAAGDPSVARLIHVLRAIPLEVPALSEHPTRDAALIATLWAIGLKRAMQLEAAIVLARLPATIAEAAAERATNFAHYPIHLPPFEYRDPPLPSDLDQPRMVDGR